jgi:hypothetical protein
MGNPFTVTRKLTRRLLSCAASFRDELLHIFFLTGSLDISLFRHQWSHDAAGGSTCSHRDPESFLHVTVPARRLTRPLYNQNRDATIIEGDRAELLLHPSP